MNICKLSTIKMAKPGCKTWNQQGENLSPHAGKLSRGYAIGRTRASVFPEGKYRIVELPIFFIIFLGLGVKSGEFQSE
ncbi:hypothetical protein [Phormidium sp. CCY1219]|uniref:hypothetical protein n=1 Tax=Phormidium sp. CCY1219 TaxID=2886104 RepID=UPI002D1ED859|nr:hypothetical protein [Phormidium sp. CCY1219]MEB3829551.1 hypothetical protein [Phormidium sp. CCY1219]